MLARKRSVAALLRNQSIQQIKPAIHGFIQHLASRDGQRKLVGGVKQVVRDINLIGQGKVDQIRHADAFALPLVVQLQNIRQAGIAGTRVGEDPANGNAVIGLLKHQLVWQMARVPDRK